ncbi:hypothetical protein AB6F62_16525 [Providencia huaxiensis]|uniref:hypothetical protein n=1 Tax=Providencia huaxiensis TaxID=2027290 RepID=UPI0034DD446D
MAETGVSLQWLATGQGKVFDDEELDVLRLKKYKIVMVEEFDSGMAMFDKVLFKQNYRFKRTNYGSRQAKLFYCWYQVW